jgi:hypothetical protein
MTDSAPIVLTASVLMIILQIILIVLVLDKKKKAKVITEEKPVHHEIKDPKKPRENENRFTRRPPLEQRVKPAPAPAQNPDQMERSLRDINLRLKNAERDQEKERRRIKDTIGNGPQQKRGDFSRPRDRNEGFRRNERPRQDFQQRQASEPQKPIVREEMPIKPAPVSAAPVDEQKEIKPIVSVIPANNPSPIAPVELKAKPSDSAFEIEPIEIENSENLQHGRKFAVKRRVLKAEDQEEKSEQPLEKKPDEKGQSDAASAEKSSITISESNNADDVKSETPISFGR